MLNTLKKVVQRLRGCPARPERDLAKIFKVKYTSFKELLASNSEILNIMVDVDEKLRGHKPFGMSYVRSQSTLVVFHALRMVKSLNTLSNNRYPQLYTVLDEINARIKAVLEEKKDVQCREYVMPYSRINKEMVDWVGGKNANLGELCSRINLPIPEGFAITTRAMEEILVSGDLHDEIKKIKMEMDLEDLETVTSASERIQALIISAEVPADLEQYLLQAYAGLAETIKAAGGSDAPRVALRSSALGEDSELSFAGQYLTFLNVPPERLIQTYKFILASLYTPRAIIYRVSKGIKDEDSAMSVACLEMVRSVCSGVMYSRHPFNLLEDKIIINAVWGLGPYAVDGTVNPDTYVVSKDSSLEILEKQVARKEVQLVSRDEEPGGLMEIPVPLEMQNKACLDEAQIKNLAACALRLEEHYKTPQDTEWAVDVTGRLFILQTRPLNFQAGEQSAILPMTPLIKGYPLLLEGGAIACPGVGYGPAHHIRSEDDLKEFPSGGVLVAKRSNPQFVVVMSKAKAIVTDAGSVTGHMASLAREFDVPAILGANDATASIAHGSMVTVDAFSARVYEGEVHEILAFQKPKVSHMQDTPVYQVLRKVSELLVPLNLSDPKAATFTPENCRTLHDITRFVHEVSYQAMFQISDFVSDEGSCSMKLTARLPLDLYVIDLGGGLVDVAPGASKIDLLHIASIPFKALLDGLLHDGLRWHQPRPIEFKGLMSVMSQQLMGPGLGAERFGDRSYAIISDKYLNFSSRVGYHYAVLDSYCGQTINKNYVSFSFKGGAADDVRRTRRVRAIARILEEQEFTVTVKGDRVDARFQKDSQDVVEKKLDQLGRLLIFTRQMDMLMATDAHVELISRCFLEEDYELCALDRG